MPIKIDEIIRNAFKQAFSRALEQTLQNKAEALFIKAFENGSPLSKKLDEKIDQGLRLLADPHRPPPARPAGEGDWRANATWPTPFFLRPPPPVTGVEE